MVRAHVAALGGNAVVSYNMKECVFMENPNKNQVRMSGTTTKMQTSEICSAVNDSEIGANDKHSARLVGRILGINSGL